MSDEATLASGYGGAYEAGWQSGREDGRKEERARIRAKVQGLRDEWVRGYGYCGIDLDINVRKAFHEVLTLVEDTTNE
jgi:hypothetical protein